MSVAVGQGRYPQFGGQIIRLPDGGPHCVGKPPRGRGEGARPRDVHLVNIGAGMGKALDVRHGCLQGFPGRGDDHVGDVQERRHECRQILFPHRIDVSVPFPLLVAIHPGDLPGGSMRRGTYLAKALDTYLTYGEDSRIILLVWRQGGDR